jgi:hypothetical protein
MRNGIHICLRQGSGTCVIMLTQILFSFRSGHTHHYTMNFHRSTLCPRRRINKRRGHPSVSDNVLRANLRLLACIDLHKYRRSFLSLKTAQISGRPNVQIPGLPGKLTSVQPGSIDRDGNRRVRRETAQRHPRGAGSVNSQEIHYFGPRLEPRPKIMNRIQD